MSPCWRRPTAMLNKNFFLSLKKKMFWRSVLSGRRRRWDKDIKRKEKYPMWWCNTESVTTHACHCEWPQGAWQSLRSLITYKIASTPAAVLPQNCGWALLAMTMIHKGLLKSVSSYQKVDWLLLFIMVVLFQFWFPTDRAQSEHLPLELIVW